jgi:hypothetical protein
VPALRVGDRQPTHEFRQLAVAARPKHEMPMIRHHAPSENSHRQPLFGLVDSLLERLEVSPFLARRKAPKTHRELDSGGAQC